MLSYTIIVNSIVHIFMYAYYLSSIFAKQLPFSLVPVKKFVTLLQIVSTHLKLYETLDTNFERFTFSHRLNL